jgi:4-diphosphocytidyl-2-C-methyl-D-erythritol kinase
LTHPARETAPAKLNLALHVRGKRSDGRHEIETVFAFCTDGDRLSAEPASDIGLAVTGPFARELGSVEDNLVIKAARALAAAAGVEDGAALTLEKKLPVASGIGGGSADAAAALRLLTSLWQIDPKQAERVAHTLGSDVPACLLSLPMRGEGAGDELTPIDLSDVSGVPVLLINPRVQLSTADVFARWDGEDRGPLGDWREGRNDLERPASALVPQIKAVLAWLGTRPGTNFVRLSGSGATCFAPFDTKEARDAAADSVPREWWRLATFLR